MVTSKITSVIKKAERLNTSFNLLLTCGISLELSFLDAKDISTESGNACRSDIFKLHSDDADDRRKRYVLAQQNRRFL